MKATILHRTLQVTTTIDLPLNLFKKYWDKDDYIMKNRFRVMLID